VKTKQSKNSVLLLLAIAYLLFAQFSPFVHTHEHFLHAHTANSLSHSHQVSEIEHDVHADDNHHGCCQVSSAESVALQSAKVDKADNQQNHVEILATEGAILEQLPVVFTVSILEPASQEFYKACSTRAPPSIS
jgi:hypothetical protein